MAGNRFIELTKMQFGRLIVVGRAPSKNGNIPIKWLCKCDCGNESIVDGGKLRSGRTKSCGCIKMLPKGENAFNRLYGNYKLVASKRNHEWKLTKDEFRKLLKGDCFYCGLPPSQVKGNGKGFNGTYTYSGVDRKDNNLGYTLDNCVSCCKQCNWAKRQLSCEDYMKFIKRVYEYNYDGGDE